MTVKIIFISKRESSKIYEKAFSRMYDKHETNKIHI